MAKSESRGGAGRLKNGWNMIARDLDRAFALAMLGTYEVFMLQVVREESWAASLRGRVKGQPLPDPIPCKPNCSALARVAGLNRCLVSRGLNDLVEARVLVRDPDGTVLINKQFDEWVYPATSKTPARPRFDAAQLEYIRGAEATRKGRNCYPGVAGDGGQTATPEYQFDKSHTATPEYQNGVATATPEYQFDPATATQEYQSRNGTATQEYQDCYPGVAVTATQEYQSPIEERGRDERVESKENSVADACAGEGSKAAAKAFDVKDCPAYPKPDDLFEIRTDGNYPMVEAEARKIYRMLWVGFGNRQVCIGFFERQRRFPADIWIAAIRTAKKRDVAVGSIGYIEKIAGSYMLKGIPADESMDAPGRSRAPDPPVEYHTAPLNSIWRQKAAQKIAKP